MPKYVAVLRKQNIGILYPFNIIVRVVNRSLISDQNTDSIRLTLYLSNLEPYIVSLTIFRCFTFSRGHI